MNRYSITGKSTLMLICFLTTLLAFSFLIAEGGDKRSATAVWTDDFNSPVLDSRWTWVREDPSHWSLKEVPGQLRIITQEGGIYEDTTGQRNLLLTDAPKGDFTMTVKCAIAPTENFQYAGLMVYQDDDNYVQLNRAFTDEGSFNFDMETVGKAISQRIPRSATSFYLRISKQGDRYSGDYSPDAETWIPVGQGTAALSNSKIGICAGNNLPKVPEISADFDSFMLYTGGTPVN